jgi:hypothetical protein
VHLRGTHGPPLKIMFPSINYYFAVNKMSLLCAASIYWETKMWVESVQLVRCQAPPGHQLRHDLVEVVVDDVDDFHHLKIVQPLPLA